MHFIVKTIIVFSVAEAAAVVTYLAQFSMMTIDVFFLQKLERILLTHLMRFLIVTFYRMNTQHNTQQQT
jgi:hypothetical protein